MKKIMRNKQQKKYQEVWSWQEITMDIASVCIAYIQMIKRDIIGSPCLSHIRADFINSVTSTYAITSISHEKRAKNSQTSVCLVFLAW